MDLSLVRAPGLVKSTGHTTVGRSSGCAGVKARLFGWDRAGVWHAASVGADEVADGRDDKDLRGARFWVKLARKGKQPSRSRSLLLAVIPRRTFVD